MEQVLNNYYQNDTGDRAEIVCDSGAFTANVGQNGACVGPYTRRNDVIDELLNMGFYESQK